MTTIIAPHGGVLKDLIASEKKAEALKTEAMGYVSWDLTERQLWDIEMLLCGAFSPLEGFLGKDDYASVLKDMRLSDGTVWPVPITLDVKEEFAEKLKTGTKIALRDHEGVLIAVMTVGDIWKPDKKAEAELVLGSTDDAHPGVDYLLNRSNPVYIGGKLQGVEMPRHYDFKYLRNTPKDLRDRFKKLGWTRVVAFQTRNPMHRAHQELTFRAAQKSAANLLIHPVVGMTKPGDIDHYSRIRCYEYLIKQYPEQTTMLSLLPLAMRMGGPRECVWHAIIRKNYGCTHFIVGRNHADPGNNKKGEPFYGPFDAQELLGKLQSEIGIEMVAFPEMVFVQEKAEYVPSSEVNKGDTVLNISGTEFRRRLAEGLDIPEWFSYKEVVNELRRTYPPKHKQGFTVFFTGLSGSGKSTVANALMVKLMETGGRRITILDGDMVRKNLSSELGFSREHRDLNIQRIGFVASEITKHGGIAICCPIAPYSKTRNGVRDVVSQSGGFVEVHVSTSVETCEGRDRKGLYAKARAGIIKEFTGISDPYEAPENPEVVIDTKDCSPDEASQRIILKLEQMGYIK
ncbi:MAG: bifunctional sulfate adenylyltransferase/adenylylsulfate kinase [Deltaproteobacteria bacterium]|nr:bifunctional sulfate adenylyltransferase/adenylylsulfate kinase [Deltaproteobacteria bacterium]